MKKIGIFWLVIALAMVFAIPSGTFAAEATETETLPEAGMAPNSPFYFMERWGEQISLAFTFSAENKVYKALRHAEERLAEAEAMAEQNKIKAMLRATNEYKNCVATITRNMEKAMSKGIDTSEQVTTMMSKHISYMYQYQHSYQNGDTECTDCRQNMQQIRERAQTCLEDTVEVLASQDPEAALQLGVRLMEQACIRIQNMVGQADSEEMEEALQQCQRLRVMNQEMVANGEQLGLGPEAQQMMQQATATQEGILNQIRNRLQINSESAGDTPVQNQVQEQQGGAATGGVTDNTQSGAGPMESTPNSGDGVPNETGSETMDGGNGRTNGQR